MTTKEMMEVMQHYENGGKVEIRVKEDEGGWVTVVVPSWNWVRCSYRIKPEQKKTKTVWFWKVKLKTGMWLSSDYMFPEEEIKKSFPDALEFKRMDVLGSEEVEV